MLYGCINENTRPRGSLGNSALGGRITEVWENADGDFCPRIQQSIGSVNQKHTDRRTAKSLQSYFLKRSGSSHAKFVAEDNYDDWKDPRTRNLRLHGAFTWRHFRFIVIGSFYPFLASFVDQRTLLAVHNNQKMIYVWQGLRTRDLRLHGAFTRRHFRFIVTGGFYPSLASFVTQRTSLAVHNNQKMIYVWQGLRTRDLRLRGAFTWHQFRFITIDGFYPLLASFVDQSIIDSNVDTHLWAQPLMLES